MFASNWLSTARSAELGNLLRSVAETEITLRAEDAGRVMLQHRSSPRDAERALFAFRRAMMPGDELWTAAVGGILSLGTLPHAPSTELYLHHSLARDASGNSKCLPACSAVRPITGSSGRLILAAGRAFVGELERGDAFLPVNRDSFREESQRLPVDRRRDT